MKKVLIAAILLFGSTSISAQNELNIMTFNIRYDNAGDSLNAWPFRKELAASQVLFHKVHLMGVQEAMHHQLQDLQKGLTRFNYVGVGRADGKYKGEFSAIFYDTLRLQLLQSETFTSSSISSTVSRSNVSFATCSSTQRMKLLLQLGLSMFSGIIIP